MDTIDIISPYDDHFIQSVEITDEKGALAVLQKAYEGFVNHEKSLAPHQRLTILSRFYDLLIENQHELAYLATEEGGKPLPDSLIEVRRAAEGVRSAIAALQMQGGREIPMSLTESSSHRVAFTQRKPRGVVLAISAFNHPVNLIIHQIIPAIAVGAPVIIKPATKTPLSCFRLIELLRLAGLPDYACQAMLCTTSITEKLVSDSHVSMLSFIGSASVGWYLRSKLSPGARCMLEHGGAAPVILEADADLEVALPLLVKGAFYHAGQVCVSVQRLFVNQKIIKVVSKKLVELTGHLRVGDPLHTETEVGPLIARHEVDRIDEWVQEAIYLGAKCLIGGERLSETCYAPTILLDPPQQARVSSREIFGPVLCLYSYKERQEAIAYANSLPFAFQAAVFTKDIDTAFDTVSRLNANTVLINDSTTFRTDWMPFGGRKQSGLGSGGIPDTMEELTYEKMFILSSSVL